MTPCPICGVTLVYDPVIVRDTSPEFPADCECQQCKEILYIHRTRDGGVGAYSRRSPCSAEDRSWRLSSALPPED